MKKKTTALLLFTLFTGALISQPTITYNGNAPQIGDEFYQSYSVDQLLPGPQGANKTWDFSIINVYETGEVHAVDVSSTPFSDVFTNANIAFNYDETGTYNYSDIQQNVAFNLGTGFDEAQQMIIYYDDPAKLLEYPFSYNDNFTDTYTGEYQLEGLLTKQSGTLTKTADAWGTITTPAGTFENVLRLKTIRDHIDSIFMQDIFISRTIITYKDYEWYTSSSHAPIFAITITNSALINDTVSYYSTGTTNVLEFESQNIDFSIVPNPAHNIINIQYTSGKKGKVDISIFDLTGKKVMYKELFFNNLDNKEAFLHIEQLNAGLYFVKINNGTNSLTKKLIKN